MVRRGPTEQWGPLLRVQAAPSTLAGKSQKSNIQLTLILPCPPFPAGTSHGQPGQPGWELSGMYLQDAEQAGGGP